MKKKPIWGILAIALIVLIIVALLISAFSEDCTPWFGGKGICYLLGAEDKKDAIGRLSIALAAALSVWGVWEARRRANAMIKTADEQEKTARITEEGRIHDRFKNAIDHLGHADEFVRLAGVHALRNLSSEQEGQRKLILSILCSRIQSITGESKYQEDNKNKPSNEIQTMMRVLFERTDENEEPWKGLSAYLSKGYFCGLELENAQFQGADLLSAQFQGADLSGAQFQGADLSGAQFQGADLSGTQFQGADLSGAQFQGADLSGTQFQGADLLGTQFQGVYLENAQFQGAFLWNAQFQRADLSGAQFQGADLSSAQFHGAYLSGTQFQGADLSGTQFQGADLSGTQFQGADLSGTQFQGADLSGTQFQGADLSGTQFQGADLENAQFQGCISDRLGQWKRHFDEQIMQRVNEDAELSGAIFAGGIQQDALYRIVEELGHIEEMSHEELDAFRNALAEHVDNPERRGADGIPEQYRDGLELGAYIEAEAKEWIASYEKSMKTTVPPDDA